MSLPREIVAEPIEGWRAWAISRPQATDTASFSIQQVQRMAHLMDEGKNPFREMLLPSLMGIGHSVVWPAGTNTACCHRGVGLYLWDPLPGERHEAPAVDCGCGVWALKERADLDQTLAEYPDACVYGRVQIWGRIIEQQRGWRGQHARAVELVLIGGTLEDAAGLAERYGVPVIQEDESRKLKKARAVEARKREVRMYTHNNSWAKLLAAYQPPKKGKGIGRAK